MTSKDRVLKEQLLGLEPLILDLRANRARVDKIFAVLRGLGGELWEAGGETVADPSGDEGKVLWAHFTVSGVPEASDTSPNYRGIRYRKGHELAKMWDGGAPGMGVLRDEEVTAEMKSRRELGERILKVVKDWQEASRALGAQQKYVDDKMAEVLL